MPKHGTAEARPAEKPLLTCSIVAEQRANVKVTPMQSLSQVLPEGVSKFKPQVDAATCQVLFNKKPVGYIRSNKLHTADAPVWTLTAD